MAWTATERSRRPSSDNPNTWDVTVEFTDGENVFTKTFRFLSTAQITADFANRTTQAIERLKFRVNPLNEIDSAYPGAGEILVALIRYIRANPACTLNQVITRYDAAYPNAIWKAASFLKLIQDYLKDRIKTVVTWDQFKAYVISAKVVNIDG